MSYIEGRVVHDADAHIMETPNWLRDHADPAIRDRIDVPGYANELKQTGDEPADLDATFARLAERHRTESNFRIETTIELRAVDLPPTAGLYD